MGNDLISRAAALNALLMSKDYRDAHDALEQLPAVDAVPVVRCKDCCKRNTNYCAIAWTESDPFIGEQVISEFYEPDDPDNWFCADGERANAPTCGPDFCKIGGDEE